MKIAGIPFDVTDWSQVEAVVHPGETGTATWRTRQLGEIRVRLIEYSPGYRADHWCARGHVILVLDGVLDTEIQGGPVHTLTAGMVYHVADDEAPHRSSTTGGARLFIVD